MARFDPIATNWTSGELSKLLIGRVDLAKYANGADTLENFLIMLQGGITRRPGSRYVASTKDDGVARLLPFQYSADQDYVMEMGDEYLRFYSNAADAVTVTSWPSTYKLLLHCDGSDESTTIIDEIGKSVTPVGTAQLDTAIKKWGTASLLLDGDSDYLIVPNSEDFNFDGNFCIEGWFYWKSNAATTMIASQCDTAGTNAGWYFIWNQPNGKLEFHASNGGAGGFDIMQVRSAAWTPNVDTWYFIRVERIDGVIEFYVDGVNKAASVDAGDDSSAITSTQSLYIGRFSDASSYFNGQIDEFLITKGATVQSTTVPTTEYAKTESTEITAPYAEADIFEVQTAHKGDLKYLTHGDYAPRIITRTDATTFSIDLADIKRGPFLDDNEEATTVTPSADTGAGITITFSAATLDYDGDLADDAQSQVGALWRIKDGVVKILTVTSTTVATADVQAEPDGTAGDLNTGPAAVTDWAEGAFSAYRGYPAVCCFHDGRLWYASTEYEPQKIWGSNTYDYDNFDEGSAGDSEAVTFEIATEERVAIRWMSSGNKALSLGSSGGTFSAFGTSNGPITPSDVQVNRDTNYGSALLPAKRISSFLFYVQRNLHKVRELSYYYDYDVTRATDMTMLAEHIIRDGDSIVDWAYQQSPTDRLWCVRDDGEMAVLTRNPEQEVMGWSRVISGTDSSGETGKYESVCVIPKENDDDQVWVIVNRSIDGSTKRFIEYFTKEDFTDTWDAVCLDSSLTLDDPITITGATTADPVVITAVDHGLSNGDYVRIDGLVGMTELNGNTYKVANKADDTFELTDTSDEDIDGSEYSDYISGGEAREMVTSVSGLSHLNGETVQAQVDSSVETTNSYTVAAGAITLAARAAVVHVGLPYVPLMKTLRPEGGSQIGTAQGKIKRIPNIVARFYKTLAAKLGTSDTQDEFTFSEIYTGDKTIPVPIGWERASQIVLTSAKPLPLTLISLMPNINTSDM